VTNQQFAPFIDVGGYGDRQWWSSEGWAWLRQEKAVEPGYWHDRRWNAPNQPVVGVSLWEAEAFCAWGGGRLPTQEEWEVAARGPKGLVYPWGNAWQDGICNTREAGLDVTSPVGLFPRARQADSAIDDLVGNVAEWCSSLYYTNDKDHPVVRAFCGGAFGFDHRDSHLTRRLGALGVSRDQLHGFRVVCGSPISGH